MGFSLIPYFVSFSHLRFIQFEEYDCEKQQ